ncbi:hypothetical protein GQ457_08G010310 [Hibiscus cannabinus]
MLFYSECVVLWKYRAMPYSENIFNCEKENALLVEVFRTLKQNYRFFDICYGKIFQITSMWLMYNQP